MAPGSLIWDPNDCSGFTANPILPGSNSSRVCGLQTQDESALSKCCQTPIEKYTCWTYCATNQPYVNFASCVSNNVKRNVSDIFCLSATNSTINQTTTSAATPRTRAPTMASLIVMLCVLAFFLDPASARIIPSLGNNHIRRADDSTCQFKEDHHYVRTGTTHLVSSSPESGEGLSVTVDSGIGNNNRTINGTSAAEASYDDFFSLLSKQFGRQFPAMSSIETVYEFSAIGHSAKVGFTPFNWCVNGTATGCGNVLRDMNGSVPLVACGPVFVSDSNSTQSVENVDGEMIQGTLGPIVSVVSVQSLDMRLTRVTGFCLMRIILRAKNKNGRYRVITRKRFVAS